MNIYSLPSFLLYFPLCTIEKIGTQPRVHIFRCVSAFFLTNFTYGAITRIFTMNFPYFSSVAIHSSCLFFTCATYYLPGQFPKSVICIFLLFGWAGIPSTHNVTLLKCSNLLLIYKGVISTHICSFSFLELH